MTDVMTKTIVKYEAAPGVMVSAHVEVKNGELSEEEIKYLSEE